MLATNSQNALRWIHDQLGLSGEGDPANHHDQHGELPRLSIIMGQGLARLHGIDIRSAPLATGWNKLDAVIQGRLEGGLIDPSILGKPYDLYAADRLVELWRSGRPAEEDLVICCGEPTLENLLIADSQLSGFLSAANAVIADRHLDLAVAQQSVHAELGSEAVFSFYEGYGLDANIVKLDHYVLATRLLGIVK